MLLLPVRIFWGGLTVVYVMLTVAKKQNAVTKQAYVSCEADP